MSDSTDSAVEPGFEAEGSKSTVPKKVFQNDSRRRQQRIAQASLRNARWISGVRS